MFQRNSLARSVDNLITLMQSDDVEIEAAQRAASDVLRAAQGANTRQLSEAVQRLAMLVPGLKIGRAAMLAITCGALVERGAEMQPIAAPSLARFADAVRDGLPFLEACLAEATANPLPPHHHHHHDHDHADDDASEDDADDDDGGGGSPAEDAIVHYGGVVSERIPETAQAFGSLEWLNTAALAMLSRSKALRAQLRADESLVQTIRRWDALGLPLPCSHKMLSILDDGQVVLHPGMGRGYLIRIAGIGDNFQLHTLLAGALIGDEAQGWLPGERPAPEVIALAKDAPITDPAKLPTAYGSFNLWNWTGIRADGMLPDLQSNQFDGGAHWIWNEGVPADVEMFEGTRVILLGPEPYPRSWNSGRFFPAMTGELTVVRQLSADETRDWLARLASAPKPAPVRRHISADDVANP